MEDFLRLGLLNWFPMEVGATVLLLEADDAFEKDFCRRGLRTTNIKSLNELNTSSQYDYVVVSNGDSFLADIGNIDVHIRKMLKSDGHLILACNNRLALRYLVGDADPYTGRSFDGIENYIGYTEKELQRLSGRCFAKSEIEECIKRLGFAENQYRGYSVLPGLEMPQLIYSWDYLPNENMESRYTPLYNDASRIFLNETKISDSLIKNGMFHAMANAYLMDCSFEGEFYEFNQVTTSMERGEKNTTATIIQKDGKVVKKALYPDGNTTIKTLIENMECLSHRGIATIELVQQTTGKCDGKELVGVQMKCIDAPLALEYLQNLLYEDKEAFKEAVCKFMDTVLRSGDINQAEKSELGAIYKHAYFDLVPINCFVIDGEYVFFDQEYAIENYPVNVVLTRVLDFIYMGGKRTEEILPMSYFTEKYNLIDKLQIYRTMSASYLDKLKHSTELLAFHGAHKTDTRTMNVNRQKMQYDIRTYTSLFINYLKDIEDKKVFLFGSGLWAKKFMAEYGDRITIDGILDNNSTKWGTSIDGICVMEPSILSELEPSSYKVIVCVKQYAEIVMQLKSLGTSNYGIYDPNIDISELMCCSNVNLRNENACDLNSHTRNTRRLKVQQSSENDEQKPYHVGFVAGVFDLFHVGHLNLLRRAKEQCDVLLVGVVSDEQASRGKRNNPYIPEQERLEIVEACRYVDKAFILPIVSASARDVYKKYHFDVMFSGDDYKDDTYWLEEKEWLRLHGSDIVFFPYTQSTSSTKLKRAINIREN